MKAAAVNSKRESFRRSQKGQWSSQRTSGQRKTQIRPEEKLEEKEADIEYLDTESEDMDGDGSPDWILP